jgi:signal transduction histidine kinase
MTTRADFTQAFASGQPLEIERRIRHRDGQYRWFLLRHAPVRDEHGRITQWFGAATDIHERRMAQVMLEHQVAMRTRELAAANWEMQRLSQRILQVQESERRLIAQELHDEIGQQLTGAKMLLDSLDEQLHDTRQAPPADQAQQGEQEQSTLEELSEARKIVHETLEYVRALSLELRPAVLDSLGLLAALQWQFERYTKQTGVQVDFAADGLDHRLPAQVEAGVSSVTAQIYVTEETLSLFIVDEGAGFDTEKTLVAGASTGLAGMRERANLLGGSLTIDSLPGEGTTIHAKISIPQAGEIEATQKIERDDRETPEAKVRRSIMDELRDRVRDQRRHAARDAERDTMRDAFRDITRDTAQDQRHKRKGGEP